MKKSSLYALIIVTRILSDVPLLWMFYALHFQLRNEGSGGSSSAASNAVLFIAWGAVHSLLARDFVKRYLSRLVGDSYVRIVYVWIAGATLTLLLLRWRPISGVVWQTDGVLYWFLSFLYFACVGGLIYTASSFDYLDFIGVRLHLQRATDQPIEPPVFTVKGLYAHCRHPMYSLLLAALWLTPVMTVSRFEFALLGSIYLFVGAYFEEHNLRDGLGEVYDLYRANVPMWIPRLRPWRYIEASDA